MPTVNQIPDLTIKNEYILEVGLFNSKCLFEDYRLLMFKINSEQAKKPNLISSNLINECSLN